MPHIHTGSGEHDSTASAYIVRLGQGEPRLLLHQHKKLGVFLQLGGHVELKENPWQTVLREIREESGYEADQLAVLQPPVRLEHLTGVELHPHTLAPLTHPFPDNKSNQEFNSPHFHTDLPWAFVTEEPPRLPVGQDESNTLQFFSVSELKDLAADNIPEDVRQIGLFVLGACLDNWEKVPIANF